MHHLTLQSHGQGLCAAVTNSCLLLCTSCVTTAGSQRAKVYIYQCSAAAFLCGIVRQLCKVSPAQGSVYHLCLPPTCCCISHLSTACEPPLFSLPPHGYPLLDLQLHAVPRKHSYRQNQLRPLQMFAKIPPDAY